MIVDIQAELLKIHLQKHLEPLLKDKTTKTNILWATDAYRDLGKEYHRDNEIRVELITGEHSDVIKSRATKELHQQSERTRQHAEVFTPLWICEKMNDHIDEVWFNRRQGIHREDAETGHIKFTANRPWKRYVDSRRLEITCGEAPYLVSRYDVSSGEAIPLAKRTGILDRKLRAVNENAETEKEWVEWAIRAFHATYGYEFQGDNLLIARVNLLMSFEEYLFERWNRKPTEQEYKKIINILCWNIWQMDGLTGTIPYRKAEEESPQMDLFSLMGTEADAEEKDRLPQCRIYDWRRQNSLAFLSLNKGERNMKFDYIIGNPPYQEESSGDSNTATPIYNLFMDSSAALSDRILLITPARFLFNAGYTPKEWNKKMLSDTHFSVLDYYPDSSKVFSGVDIKGGVAISYKDRNKEFGAIEIFTNFPALNQILRKVINNENFKPLSDVIVSSFAYHFTSDMYKDNPDFVGRASKGHSYDIQSNAFETFPELFFDDISEDEQYIRILGRDNGKRKFKYIKKKYVTNVSNLDGYKVFFAKAAGTGQFGEVLPEGISGKPGDGNTVTYLSIGNYDSIDAVTNCAKYIKTKFARAMLGVLKVTQDITPSKWKYVPLQDFTPSSDIDWSKPIPEIDRQLYAKYGLDEKEIEFIESHVKEMA